MLKPTHRLKIAFLYSIKCTIGGSSDGQSKNHFGDAVMDPAEKQLKAWRQFWVSCRALSQHDHDRWLCIRLGG
jgi:hypothetical protein